MELFKYIGFKLDDVRPLLEQAHIHYEIIETFDTKRTILGDECRIINIKSSCSSENGQSETDTIIRIYVAYF